MKTLEDVAVWLRGSVEMQCLPSVLTMAEALKVIDAAVKARAADARQIERLEEGLASEREERRLDEREARLAVGDAYAEGRWSAREDYR